MNGHFVTETPISISGPAGALEAILTPAAGNAKTMAVNDVAILCHPHPLHGGTMNNKVVTTLARTYRDLGVAAVRFNFRGVGQSEGTFARGIGELADALAVASWVQSQFPQARLLLAGFSFGSAIAAQASYQVPQLQHLVLIAPPVGRYIYDKEGRFPCGVCVVQGGQDERVEAGKVRQWVERLKSPVRLLYYPEAGHFFHGHLTRLKTDLTEELLPSLSAHNTC